MCGAAAITLNTEQAGVAFEYFQVLDRWHCPAGLSARSSARGFRSRPRRYLVVLVSTSLRRE